VEYIKPPWTQQREKVLLDRYVRKDERGEPLEATWDEVASRVSSALALVEKEKDREKYAAEFFDALKNFRVVPGGRVIAAAGTNTNLTYFNCTVIPVECDDPTFGNDSRQGIMDTMKKMVEITSRGGGVGINWSVLRPRGSYVRGVNGRSSGSVSWMEAAGAVAQQVEQGGSRRAALMFMLWDWHPDLLEFLEAKSTGDSKLENANLSVALSNKFMEAVEKDGDWIWKFPDYTHPDYNRKWNGSINTWEQAGLPVVEYGLDSEGNVVPNGKPVKARWIWEKIIKAAHSWGEPGIVFLERYNEQSNLRYREEIISVNPCGEQGLGPYGVCNLCSINLVSHVRKKGGILDVDYDLLRKSVETAVRLSDNVIELDNYFLPQFERSQRLGARRIGIGTMGLADLLILKEIRYGSKESLDFIDALYRFIAVEAYRSSIELAVERGSFPWFDREAYLKGYFIKRLPEDVQKDIARNGIRNSVLLTQAPTGTTSILAGVSSGIEPVFSFSYVREDRTGTYHVRHWLAEKFMKENPGRPLPPYFVSALDLTPEEHVLVQAAVQKHTDSSISKTVNAPFEHSLEEVNKLFKSAYNLGCKGITYFRIGTRKAVLKKKEDGFCCSL